MEAVTTYHGLIWLLIPVVAFRPLVCHDIILLKRHFSTFQRQKMEGASPQWIRAVSILLFVCWTILCICTDNTMSRFIPLTSGFFGFILKFAGFGFTSSFRALLRGEIHHFSRFILVLLVSTLFIQMTTSGLPARPVTFSLILGSLLFGIGMQLGSGCASGTLVGIGQGSIKSCIVFVAFCVGACISCTNMFVSFTRFLSFSHRTISISPTVHILILIAAYAVFTFYSRRKVRMSFEISDFKKVGVFRKQDKEFVSFWNSLLVACSLGLCVVGFYALSGRTIGVMGPFSIIGVRILSLFGAKPEKWEFFKVFGIGRLFGNVFFRSDVSIVLGAFVAAAFQGTVTTSWTISPREICNGIIGGLLMGIGGKLAGGCNIGAMLSGINSNSLSGYVWMICAIVGNAVGMGVLERLPK